MMGTEIVTSLPTLPHLPLPARSHRRSLQSPMTPHPSWCPHNLPQLCPHPIILCHHFGQCNIRDGKGRDSRFSMLAAATQPLTISVGKREANKHYRELRCPGLWLLLLKHWEGPSDSLTGINPHLRMMGQRVAEIQRPRELASNGRISLCMITEVWRR